MKICSKCKIEYPATTDYFEKRRDSGDGLRAQCKKCRKKVQKDYYIKNREGLLAKAFQWGKEHKEQRLDICRKYRQNNREKAQEYNLKYRRQYPEKCRNSALKCKYGVPLNQYDKLQEQQKRVCAICGRPERFKNQYSKVKNLAVDHNHKTEKIRGLLCQTCNTALGAFEVDKQGIELLCSAISYIRNTDGVENELMQPV